MGTLENVKAGDKLRVSTGYAEGIETVERVTATLVITKSHRFIKNSGKAQGCDSWTFVWAIPATAEDAERINRAARRRGLIRRCKNINFGDLTDSELEEVLKIANKD